MSMPAISLNSSPDMCTDVPLPEEAKLSLPGLAFACAMNSATVLAGKSGGTTIRFASRKVPATGTVSRMKLNGSFL